MTTPTPQYTGMMAEFWDLFRGDSAHWADQAFFQEVIAQSGLPVLDVGCGTGRLLLDFLADGVDIDGIDNSPAMLDLCRQKAASRGLHPQVYLQTMENLDLPRRYRTIIVPSGSIQILIDPATVRQAMARFWAHLMPGGQLVVFFYQLWTGKTSGSTATQEWMREVVRPADGAIVRRWMRSTYDLVNNLEDVENRYDVIRDGVVVESQRFHHAPATRGYTQEQACQIFLDAGFGGVRVTGGFTQQAATAEATLFSVWGTRP